MLPVRIQTTVSESLIVPSLLSFLSPAIEHALAGSHPIPELSTTTFAFTISSSLTCSTRPFVNLITSLALTKLTGFPIRMAVAIVSALIGFNSLKSSFKLSKKGFAPLA